MTRIAKGLCLLSALALWQGCSSTSDNNDASDSDGAANPDSGPDGSVLGLTRGMSYFKITAVSGISDECGINPADFVRSSVDVRRLSTVVLDRMKSPVKVVSALVRFSAAVLAFAFAVFNLTVAASSSAIFGRASAITRL